LNSGVSRTLRLLALTLGVGVVLWLVTHADVAALVGAFAHIGWGFALIVAARGATIAVDCAAWRALLPRAERPAVAVMLKLRWIAEAINTTLPVAQVGGDVVRARLLQRLVAAPARGAASVAVDFALSLFVQILFTLVGFVLLARLGDTKSRWPIVLCIVLAAVFALLSWELLAKRRVLGVAIAGARRLRQRRLAAALLALRTALGLLAESPAALLRALARHAASFVGHAGELWLTLHLMGRPTGFAAATMLESLSLAARSAAFLIPSGWGAQEAALVALAAAAGLSPDAALAVGLVKRARELAVGLPGLAAWGLAERRLG
jgi:putative membrane protein